MHLELDEDISEGIPHYSLCSDAVSESPRITRQSFSFFLCEAPNLFHGTSFNCAARRLSGFQGIKSGRGSLLMISVMTIQWMLLITLLTTRIEINLKAKYHRSELNPVNDCYWRHL